MKGFALVGPLERLGHGAVEVVERAQADEVHRQAAEPVPHDDDKDPLHHVVDKLARGRAKSPSLLTILLYQ